mmetsp:Transcript_11132/g.32737  ORF Transcript_11132/g.32737 Transcript_11132/m.32737 type:complete len:223 (+) Transcript_11132:1009-1677(+)
MRVRRAAAKVLIDTVSARAQPDADLVGEARAQRGHQRVVTDQRRLRRPALKHILLEGIGFPQGRKRREVPSAAGRAAVPVDPRRVHLLTGARRVHSRHQSKLLPVLPQGVTHIQHSNTGAATRLPRECRKRGGRLWVSRCQVGHGCEVSNASTTPAGRTQPVGWPPSAGWPAAARAALHPLAAFLSSAAQAASPRPEPRARSCRARCSRARSDPAASWSASS